MNYLAPAAISKEMADAIKAITLGVVIISGYMILANAFYGTESSLTSKLFSAGVTKR